LPTLPKKTGSLGQRHTLSGQRSKPPHKSIRPIQPPRINLANDFSNNRRYHPADQFRQHFVRGMTILGCDQIVNRLIPALSRNGRTRSVEMLFRIGTVGVGSITQHSYTSTVSIQTRQSSHAH
jgi:hypothetical protein